HFIDGVHQKSGFSVLDQLRESARAKSGNRSTASERLHRDQRTGFRRKTGDEQTSSPRQKITFSSSANLAEKFVRACQVRGDHLLEVLSMRAITKYGSSKIQRHAAFISGLNCKMVGFFRANSADAQKIVTLLFPRPKQIEIDSVLDDFARGLIRGPGLRLS